MIYLTLGLGLALVALDYLRPARTLPTVPRWHLRAVGFNLAQLAMVFIGAWLWDGPLQSWRLFDFSDLHPAVGGGIAYLVSTFIYYWWHRARHESDLLWRFCHQLHHSPSRLEVLTSFYKHPLEMAANGLLTSVITFALLGLTVEAAAVNTLLCAGAEYFYHMNRRTPRWLGWIIQRPEMHRIHHERGAHRHNYADLPIWDLLFGTFSNPPDREVECGFEPALEAQVGAMLLATDVHRPARPGRGRAWALRGLLGLGLLQMSGDVLARVWPGPGRALAGLGAITLSSPKAKVFNRVGDYEPFGFDFRFEITTADGAQHDLRLDAALYDQIEGPYMLRNVYGAMLAFQPVLPRSTVTEALAHGLCGGPLRGALPLNADPVRARIHTTARGLGAGLPDVEIECLDALAGGPR